MTNDDVIQLTEEDIDKLEPTEKETNPEVDKSVGDLGPHRDIDKKFDLFNKYKNKKVVFKFMKLVGSNNVAQGQVYPEIVGVDKTKDTITFTKMYIPSVEAGTNTGVLYSDDVIIEHASWLSVVESAPPSALGYSTFVGVDKTLIIEE